jgi:hypothetical protein
MCFSPFPEGLSDVVPRSPFWKGQSKSFSFFFSPRPSRFLYNKQFMYKAVLSLTFALFIHNKQQRLFLNQVFRGLGKKLVLQK